MRVWVIYGCLVLLSCGAEPKESATTSRTTDTTITTTAAEIPSETDLSFAKDDTPAEEPQAPPPTKRPSGVYRFLLPEEGGQKILHTVSFSSGTFRLQEEYGEKWDSVVVTEGTWAPSRDFIWLYKDQVVRGRYTWNGDTLQYYSPRLKKTFPMEKLSPVRTRDVWQQKRAEGALLFAVGNEPFWSAEITRDDTLLVSMPDWNEPLRVKITAANTSSDSTVYTTTSDSLQVTLYPRFCNDGMSDFLYTKRVKLVYKGQTYQGCGERFRSFN
jgi:uncharacterized membrane protein